MPLRDFRSVHLPYCLKRQDDGKYIVLNREYNPLGFVVKQDYHCDDYPIAVKIKGLTALKASKISHNGSDDLDEIFLYNDACLPDASDENMQAYFERLAILAKLKFDLDEE